MGQGPIPVQISANNPSKQTVPAQSDANGNLVMSGVGGNHSALGLKTGTIVKSTAGVVVQVNVITAGSSTGSIYDTASTAGGTTANEVAVVPSSVGPVLLQFPCLVGISYVPGTGQVASISYQ